MNGDLKDCPDCNRVGTLRCSEEACWCRKGFAGTLCEDCEDPYSYLSHQLQSCEKCPCAHNSSTGFCRYVDQNHYVECAKCINGFVGRTCDHCDSQFYFDSRSNTCVKGVAPDLITDDGFVGGSRRLMVASVLSVMFMLILAFIILFIIYRRHVSRQRRTGGRLCKEDRILLAELDDWNGQYFEDWTVELNSSGNHDGGGGEDVLFKRSDANKVQPENNGRCQINNVAIAANVAKRRSGRQSSRSGCATGIVDLSSATKTLLIASETCSEPDLKSRPMALNVNEHQSSNDFYCLTKSTEMEVSDLL